MALNTDVGVVVNSVSGVLIFGLGLWVLSLRPRSAPTMGLGLMATGFGALWAVDYLVPWVDPIRGHPLLVGFLLTALALGSAGAVVLALTSPRRMVGAERKVAVVAVAACGIALAILLWELATVLDARREALAAVGVTDTRLDLETALMFGFATANALLPGLYLLYALRHRAPSLDARGRGQVRLLNTAMLLLAAPWAGRIATDREVPITGPVMVGGLLLAAAVWLESTRSLTGADRRGARDQGLLCLGLPLVGLAFASWAPEGWRELPEGIAQIVSVLVVAYAILRLQLLGLDVKARWTVKQSTIAAAFIAVFFIASEGAQLLFEGSIGPYLGIAAAGALVFAIHPLQRAAERVATTAVPMTGSPAPGARKEESYRFALRKALRDGVLTHEEERSLAHLAADLGIDAGRAFELREAVDSELAPRRASTRRRR